MPEAVTEILKLLGLATPLLYATATYALFHYLDTKASSEAKQAILSWLKSTPDTAAVSRAIVEVFDRLYSRPLLSLSAFVRSMAFSLILAGAFIWEFGREFVRTIFAPDWKEFGIPGLTDAFVTQLLGNIVSDYISLFIIRYFLAMSDRRPFLSALWAVIIGVITVICVYTVFEHLMSYFYVYTGRYTAASSTVEVLKFTFMHRNPLPYAAMAVNFWIVLFAAAAFLVRLLILFNRAVVWLEWFFAESHEHPLDVIGYAAAAIVFISAATFQAVVFLWPHLI